MIPVALPPPSSTNRAVLPAVGSRAWDRSAATRGARSGHGTLSRGRRGRAGRPSVTLASGRGIGAATLPGIVNIGRHPCGTSRGTCATTPPRWLQHTHLMSQALALSGLESRGSPPRRRAGRPGKWHEMAVFWAFFQHPYTGVPGRAWSRESLGSSSGMSHRTGLGKVGGKREGPGRTSMARPHAPARSFPFLLLHT
jgi:hypothetical protein